MSESKLCQSNGKWVAVYGGKAKTFDTMKDAAKWLDDCAEGITEDPERKEET